RDHVAALQVAGKRVILALWSEGSRDRMRHVLTDHKIVNLTNVRSWAEALARPKVEIALAVLGLETGFETDDVAVIGEQDILGDRLVRQRRPRRADNFIAEAPARHVFLRAGVGGASPTATSSCTSTMASAASTASPRSRPRGHRTTA